ncbi:hypothetical protein MUN82_08955 [Hymenobacter aerilatus]|uniref:Uncharacterized protein n=1 Tax=Hymenobacter aerilatus TaxID=2932251 RepID=A0A8T9SY90_9BACT|nr:hypothetical protein [Hymenobacter aerilatus]UOR07212.1 hypothetical protein MUN82_08955 [Hymenobacter aerilatus]
MERYNQDFIGQEMLRRCAEDKKDPFGKIGGGLLIGGVIGLVVLFVACTW